MFADGASFTSDTAAHADSHINRETEIEDLFEGIETIQSFTKENISLLKECISSDI